MELGLDAAALAAGAPEDGSQLEAAGLSRPSQGVQPGGEASAAPSGAAGAPAPAAAEAMEVDGS
jgi:hypothetical protein